MSKFTKLTNYLPGFALLLTCAVSCGLSISAGGTVCDSKGETLPGATILETGTTNGTVTDMGSINPTGLNRKI